MMEFLKGKASLEDTARIQEATSEVLSAFADKEEEGRLSPQSRRKRQLARQRSLRALKMAITPQSSPSGSTRVVKKKSVGATDSPLLQSMVVARSSETLPTSPHPPAAMPSLDHIYISPYTGKMERGASLELPTGEDEEEGVRLGDEDPGLSNSANTLIERTSTPHSDSSLPSNGSMFLPQVNSDFINSQRKLPTDLHNGFVSPSNGRLPPSYNEALSSRRRARSFEKLLDAPGLRTSIPIRPSSSAMTPSYPLHPATAGSPTRNTPTGDLRGNLITARLVKGDRGLGISISGVKTPKHTVFIQELQPGGVAEVDGKLQRGDQIVSINGQSLSGVGYKAAVVMLQQARGTVELVVLRGPAQPVSPPSYLEQSPTKVSKYSNLNTVFFIAFLVLIFALFLL